MYSYFKGEITEIEATHITIEVGGIGYLIKVSNPYSFTLNSQICLYIHHNQKEDGVDLYGFKLLNEKKMFEKLISVKGLGPKGALAILASATVDEIADAINKGQDRFFASFPGIGAKRGQQIILDLNGKLDFVESTNVSKDDRLEQVSLALKSLGYSATEIKTVEKNLKLDADTSLSEAIKIALKMLRKK